MKDILIKIIELIRKVFKTKITKKPNTSISTPVKEEKPKEPIETTPSDVIDEIIKDNITEEKTEEVVKEEPKDSVKEEKTKEVIKETPKEVEKVNIYKPRTTAPSATDKNWIKTTKGGYNGCIEIKNGSCLPNCVGYAWGRWHELLGKKPNLSRGNAENWYGNTKDGYKRGSTPKLGAVICWRKGKAGVASDGAGHVAIVEKINSDGSILTSNSAYGGTRFYTKTLKKPYSMGGKYVFQGFIYLPIDFKTEPNTGKTYSGTFPTLPSRGYFKKSDKGNQVKNLQKLLNWLTGSKLAIDGILGDKTIAKVKTFQKAVKLKEDGLFGKATLAKAKSYKK